MEEKPGEFLPIYVKPKKKSFTFKFTVFEVINSVGFVPTCVLSLVSLKVLGSQDNNVSVRS